MTTPRSKPTQLKVLEGNPGKRPLPKDEFKPEPRIPEKPPLSKEAQEIFDYYAEQLNRAGLMSLMDRDNLANCARMIARVNEIDIILQDPDTQIMISYTEMLPNGTERPVVKLNPIVREQRDLITAIRMMAPEFGMTPRGRANLVVGSTEKEPEMAKYID